MTMFADAAPNVFSAIYMCCGSIDLRKQIDGLVNELTYTYHVNPYLTENVLFLFIGKTNSYKIKGLLMEKNGFVLINKRLRTGSYKWIHSSEGVIKEISYEQYLRLMNGEKIE